MRQVVTDGRSATVRRRHQFEDSSLEDIPILRLINSPRVNMIAVKQSEIEASLR